MGEGKSILSIIAIILSLVTLALVVMIFVNMNSGAKPGDYTTEKNLAGELADNNLYHAAIAEYERILDDKNLDDQTRANLHYLIGKTYFSDLHDYENAASNYVIARSLYPDGSFNTEAGKNLITCFEKMGRILDAKRELDKDANLDSVYAEHKGDVVVAKIDDKPIFMSEINKEIQDLPAETQKQFMTPKGKLEYLNNYIATELMYQAAIREGYEGDPEIEKKKDRLGKQLMIEKYAMEKVLPEVDIDTTDMRNFYLANKDSKYDNKSYDDVKSQVLMDYQQEKAQSAFKNYIAKLSAKSKVQIFDENIK